jgi:hypothetical protein
MPVIADDDLGLSLHSALARDPGLVRDPTGEVVGVGAPSPARILEGVEVIYMGLTFATRILVGRAPKMVVGTTDFLRTFDVHFLWNRIPPHFVIVPAPSPKAPVARSLPNPTIRPKRKR